MFLLECINSLVEHELEPLENTLIEPPGARTETYDNASLRIQSCHKSQSARVQGWDHWKQWVIPMVTRIQLIQHLDSRRERGGPTMISRPYGRQRLVGTASLHVDNDFGQDVALSDTVENACSNRYCDHDKFASSGTGV